MEQSESTDCLNTTMSMQSDSTLIQKLYECNNNNIVPKPRDYCIYYFDFLNNRTDEYEILNNNLVLADNNTNEYDTNESAQLTNYFNDFDNDYDLEIGNSTDNNQSFNSLCVS